VAGLLLLGITNNQAGQQQFGWLFLLNLLSLGVLMTVLMRFGLFAVVVMTTTNMLISRTPLTLQSTQLYAGPGWLMLGVIFATAAVGLWMARRSETAPGMS
jgi:hypothetical protein